MIDVGQKSKETFFFIDAGKKKSLSIPDCDDSLNTCNYITPVMASDSGNPLENDITPILGMFEQWTTSAVFVIQKKESGTFVDKATIIDNTYGEWSPLGTFASKPKYAGFKVNWNAVKAGFNTGTYRIKVTEINPLNPGGKVAFTMEFCLKEFTCTTPENTVRFDWTNTNQLGDIRDDKNILDFGDIVWPGQLRVPMSFFGHPKSSYETEKNQLTNGEFETVRDIQTETYKLILGSVPSFIHDILKTDALMSGTLQITDYSSNNPAVILQKDVQKKSGWEPRWKIQYQCAPVTIELEPRFNNLETFRCL